MDFFLCLKVNLFFILCSMCQADVQEPCPKTSSIKNGHVKFQSRGGVTAIFTCDAGFVLRGSNVSHCQTDGHWSAPTPACIPDGQKCASADVETMTLIPGHTINISCSPENALRKAHLSWITNSTFTKTGTTENGSLVLSTRSQGLFLCLVHSETEVVILKAVKVVLTSNKSITEGTPKECSITFKDKTTQILSSFGSHISLSCEVDISTIEVSWFKDSESLNYESNVSSSALLIIPNLNASHEGNYTCIVHSKIAHQCVVSKTIIVKISNSNALQTIHSCGKPVVNVARRFKRVIDGSRAAPLSAPWMCMLSLDREPPFCGCSLISDKWIVTAAHCFKSGEDRNFRFMSREEIQKVRVKFGKQQRRKFEKGEVVRRVQNLVTHPRYRPISNDRNIANEHDIALVKLNEPVVFQPSVLPICLPPPGFMETMPSGTLGIVTGWGRVSVRDSVMALTLQEAFLPLVNNSSCQQSTNYAITENMLCAGYAESYRPDTCFGDSGGPFVLQKYNSWFLAGVVSWGEGCSSPRKFGIYTKVENYVPWIQSSMSQKIEEM